jgi:hypothetical protein
VSVTFLSGGGIEPRSVTGVDTECTALVDVGEKGRPEICNAMGVDGTLGERLVPDERAASLKEVT